MHYLEQALQLAQQAIPLSRPNPRVGCVIVSKDGHIIGRGHTQQAGQAHAEIMALRDAAERGHSAAGSTVYVTLEPCSHHGRTPPCCDALINAQVARVVVAQQDPNPLVAGRGLQWLREAGIAVEMADDAALAEAARDINAGFFQRMQHGLPWVRLKTASSLDGMTALADGRSQWITGEAARADGHRWRARACAILTGVGTILHDNPLLNVRLGDTNPSYPQPLLAIADSHLRTPPDARLWEVLERKVVLYTTATASNSRVAALQDAGAELVHLPANNQGHIDMLLLLQDLAQREVNELHVEAGSTLNGALLEAGLVDEWLAYVAPTMLGPGQPLARLPALQALPDTASWQLMDAKAVGNDARLRLRRIQQQPTS